MTPDQRRQITERIKEKVENEASVSVGITIKEVMGARYKVFSPIVESISGEIILSEKYVRIKNDWDYYILINQNPKQWREKHPFWHDALVATFGALLSLLVGYTLWLIDNQSKTRETQETQRQLKEVNRKLDSLTKIQPYQKKIVHS